MAIAVAIAHPWLHRTAERKSVFRLYQTEGGQWCVCSADRLTGGTFFNHDPAFLGETREGGRRWRR